MITPAKILELTNNRALSAYARLHPETIDPLIPLIGHPGGVHHPETVLEHSLLVTEKVEKCCLANPVPMILGALLHDVGKPAAFIPETGSMKGHEDHSYRILADWMPKFGFPFLMCIQVPWIAQNHMRFHNMHKMRTAKLADFLYNIERIGLDPVDCFKMGQCDKLSNLGGTWTIELAQEKFATFKKRLRDG